MAGPQKQAKELLFMQKIISWAALLLWMVLIFNFSSQVAGHSNRLSRTITEIVIKTAEKVAPAVKLCPKSLNNILRKSAHFFVFLVLGILVSNALRISSLHGRRCIIWALVICVLYAILDETHQLFVPGRGGQLGDVFIDCAGAGLGILLYWAGLLKISRR